MFLETFFDENNANPEEGKKTETVAAVPAETPSFPRTATVSADSFVSRAVADPGVVHFLGMRPSAAGGLASGSDTGSGSRSSTASNSHLTLREALRELVDGASGTGAKGERPESRKLGLRWEDIDALLFRPYDSTEMFSTPSSTVPIGFARVDPRGAEQQEEEVCAWLVPVGLLGTRNESVSTSSLCRTCCICPPPRQPNG